MDRAPRRRRRRRLGIVLVLALAAGGATAAGGTPPRTIALITLDTTRADHLSSYGYPRATTPFLDRLGAEGVRFARALSPMPTTDPSHATILTGLYPRTHGIRKNGATLASPGVRSLAAWARAQGYRTAAFISRKHLIPSELGLDGFDHQSGPAVGERDGGETVSQALAWLEQQGQERIFVWIHLFDPHWPYDPPEAFAKRFLDPSLPRARQQPWEPGRARYPEPVIEATTALYDGELAYTDSLVERFLTRLERRLPEDPPLVIVVGDHGEAMGELEERLGFAFDHGKYLYQGILRVPLLIRWPGRLPGGTVVDEVVELVDLAPTLFELLGAEGFRTQGRSRVGAMRGGPPGLEDAYAFSERRELQDRPRRDLGSDEQLAVQDRRYKLILSQPGRRVELYDLREDPGEERDLSRDLSAERERLLAALERWLRETPSIEGAAEIPPEKLEALRALGYVE